MNRLLIFLATTISLIIVLQGCSVPEETPGANDVSDVAAQSSTRYLDEETYKEMMDYLGSLDQSTMTDCTLEEELPHYLFETSDELMNHIKMDTVLKNQIFQLTGGSTKQADTITEIYLPNEELLAEEFGVGLVEAEIIGTKMYFSFIDEDKVSETLARKNAPPPINPETEAAAKEMQRQIDELGSVEAYFEKVQNGEITLPETPDVEMNEEEEKIRAAGGIKEYNKTREYTDEDYANIELLETDVTLCFEFASDGEQMLNNTVAMNPMSYWEDHPGYYYNEIGYDKPGEVYAYQIYWARDNYYFEVTIPAKKLDTFFAVQDSLFEMVKVK